MLTLITGGSKNGKSHMAEAIVTYNIDAGEDWRRDGIAYGGLYYIATMEPFGEEARMAIERHRRMRANKGFETIERYTDIQGLRIPRGSRILLECAGNLCANEMFRSGCPDAAGKIISGVETLAGMAKELVIVTNQVGGDGISYTPETMEYIRQMGLLNEGIAKMADCVIEVVYGIPVIRKGVLPPCVS